MRFSQHTHSTHTKELVRRERDAGAAAMVPIWQGTGFGIGENRVVRGQAVEDENKEEKNRL